MKSIEKSFKNYIAGIGPMMSKEELCAYAEKDADDLIDSIFNVINCELDSLTIENNIKKAMKILQCIQLVLLNSDQVDRKKLDRKINRCSSKVSRIKIESKNKFQNMEKATKELDNFEEELEKLQKQVFEKNTKQFDFINYLVNTVKNITYLEYAFDKMPNLIRVKDKEEHTLLYQVINNYIEAVKKEDKEDILYYENVISFILSKKKYESNEKEKRQILELLYKTIDKLSIGKKQAKQNKEKIEMLNNLVETLKGNSKKDSRINILANKYNIEVFFNENILEKAKLTRTSKVGEMTNRKKVEAYVITIDKSSAIEIDDGLSCVKLPNGNYLLGVHIKSILAHFPYESDIVQEAIRRNRSIYLPEKYQTKEDDFNRTIPIFPYEFSAKNASLLPNEQRLARSYFFEIDANGNIVWEDFQKTIVTSNRKTSYREIDKILEEGTNDKKLLETVNNLNEVTSILDKRYKTIDLYEQVKENTDDFSDIRVRRFGSEKIVYQAMVLTGNRVAEFFARKNYPCLYRVHEVNEENNRKIEAMLENLTQTYGGEEYKKLYQLIEGIYPKGWYATSGAHAGLGLKHYCHCTSGLRRAADIILEHALEVCYDKTPSEKELQELQKEIEEKALIINAKQDQIEWFVKEYKRTYRRR